MPFAAARRRCTLRAHGSCGCLVAALLQLRVVPFEMTVCMSVCMRRWCGCAGQGVAATPAAFLQAHVRVNGALYGVARFIVRAGGSRTTRDYMFSRYFFRSDVSEH